MAHYLAPGAKSDLDDIWYYIAKESGRPELADRLINTITDRFQILTAHPHIGRSRDDLRPGLRSFPVEEYIIIYRVQDSNVLILHVIHRRRDIGNLAQRSH
jgi:toxin ParE1/3/4